MPEMPVKFPFVGYDNVTPTLNKVKRGFRGLGDSSKSIFGRMKSDALSVKSVIGGILGARVVTAGIGAVRSELSTVTDQLVDFDSALVKASARYGFDRYSKEFKELGVVARDVGAKTRFTAAEAAQTIDKFAQAGIAQKDAIELSMPSAKLAIAADLGIADAAEIASTSLAVFSHNANQFGRDADVLAFTANKSKTNLAELFEVLKTSGAVGMNKSITTFSALSRALADFKIVGDKAGTALKGGLVRLMSGGRTADAELKKLRLKTYDVIGGKRESRDVLDVLEELEGKYKKMGSSDVSKSMRKLFGLEYLVGMRKIFETGISKIREYKKEAEGSAGYVDKLSGKMGLSYENKIKEIQSAAVELGFSIVDSFGKDIPKTLDKVINTVRGIDAGKIGNELISIKDTASKLLDIAEKLEPVLKAIFVGWATAKIGNGLSIATGTIADLRGRVGSFRNRINGVQPAIPTIPIGASKSAGKLKSEVSRLGNEASFAAPKISKISSALGALPILTAGASGWMDAISALSADADNRMRVWSKKSENTSLNEVGSWAKISRTTNAGDAWDQIDSINKALKESGKGQEFGLAQFIDTIGSAITGKQSNLEKLRSQDIVNIGKKELLLKILETRSESGGIGNGNVDKNAEMLKKINEIEEKQFGSGKLQTEVVIKFEGDVPKGVTSEAKTKKSPSVDTGKLGKNAA